MCVDSNPRVYHSRVHINFPDPLIVWRPLSSHTSKGLLLPRLIRCVFTSSSPLPSLLTSFKHADVNAFLVLAATRNKSKREDPADPNRAEKIIAAATAGHVPVQLVSSKTGSTDRIFCRPNRRADLSDKNPLHVLPHDADLVDLLALFAGGAHRGAKPHLKVTGQRTDAH